MNMNNDVDVMSVDIDEIKISIDACDHDMCRMQRFQLMIVRI